MTAGAGSGDARVIDLDLGPVAGDMAAVTAIVRYNMPRRFAGCRRTIVAAGTDCIDVVMVKCDN